MKTAFTMMMLIVFSILVSAQAPQKINYQAVARGSDGSPVANKNISVKFTIRQASATGTDVYAETWTTTTNALGVFAVELGGGSPTLGSFASIDWSSGAKFLNIKIDPNGGSTYNDLGTYQMLSVPYALFAENVRNTGDNDTDPFNEIQTVSIAGNELSLSKGGGSVTLPGGGGGGTPGGADGNIQFNNAGAFGGNAELIWNNATKNMGIGPVTTPSYKLDILHGGSSGLRVKSSASYSTIDVDAFTGDAALRFLSAGTNKWTIRNEPSSNNLDVFQWGGGHRMRIEGATGNLVVDTRLGLSTAANAALGGKVEIAHNSTTADPHLLLTESEADYARLTFGNTANSTKMWTIAGKSDAADGNSLLNFWYFNGTTGNDILSINGQGRVGIGTYAPSYKLEVNGASETGELHLVNTASGLMNTDGLRLGISASGANSWLWNNENGKLYFGTNNLERMSIMNDGKVGINTSTPDATLDVNGSVKVGANGGIFSEIREITGTTSASNNFISFSYPSGYTSDNIRVLSLDINYGGSAWVGIGGTDYPTTDIAKVFYYLTSTLIYIYYPAVSAFQGRAFRMLVMKMQ